MTHVTHSPPPDELVRGGDGSLWRKAGRSSSNEQVYVLDGTDLETCPRWVRMAEAELVALVGVLTPVPAHIPTSGELAEQRHLVDPLGHLLESLAPCTACAAGVAK